VGLVTAHTGGAGATERHEVGERQGGGGRLRGRWSRRRASWIVLRGGTHTIPGGLGEHSHGPGTGDRNTSGRRRAAAGVKTFECRMSGWPRVAVGRGLCRGLLPKGGLREEDGADAAKGGGRLWRALGWGRIPIDGEIDGYLALFVGGTPKKGKRVPNFNTVVSIFTSNSNSRKGDHKEGGGSKGSEKRSPGGLLQDRGEHAGGQRAPLPLPCRCIFLAVGLGRHHEPDLGGRTRAGGGGWFSGAMSARGWVCMVCGVCVVGACRGSQIRRTQKPAQIAK